MISRTFTALVVAAEFMRANAFVRSLARRRCMCTNAIELETHRLVSTSTPTRGLHQNAFLCNRGAFDARCYHAPTRACLWGVKSDGLDTGRTLDAISPVSNASNSENDDDGRERRRERLHHHLNELGVDAEALSDAAFRAATTTEGFDARFGKSAIKAYRSYVYPKPSKVDAIARENVDVASHRYARQIDFLSKRHRSREAEWVRHIDTSEHRRTFPLVLVLDNVRSAANVGSIYRSADACGCFEVLTTGITPHPGGNGAEKLSKSALGAERIVTSRHFLTTKESLEFLRKERPNFRLIGLETTERSKCYTAVRYPGADANEEDLTQAPGVALFLGNEVSGVDTEITPLLDEMVVIPMYGKKNSLNVAACAPVVMYEILRQWGVAQTSE